MHFAEVVQVLDALDAARVRHWVGGGWGVATLMGRQTREHRDLDLAIDADDLQDCLRTLDDLGYVTDIDWLPVRIELGAGLDGTHYDYPPDAFTAGTLNGRLICCLSIQQQLDFHTGYELQAEDEHDLAELTQHPHS